jgi:hypothetical protein
MKPLLLLAALSIAACERTTVIPGPPPPEPGLPGFVDAPAIYGTYDDPDKFGPGRARIEGNTLYFVADREMTKYQNDWDYNIFSRRIKYDPTAKTLRSPHRELALRYDAEKAAFVGQIKHPRTREQRYLEISVPESELPK